MDGARTGRNKLGKMDKRGERVNTAQFLGWRVMSGVPYCQKKSPRMLSKVLRAGYYTRRGKRRIKIYVRAKTENYESKTELIICGERLIMDENWKPEPSMDSWLTKWVCPRCGTVEFINRAILPLSCGGRREETINESGEK